MVEIILKSLRKNLNQDEEILFKEWLSENEDNLSTYKRLEEYQRVNGDLPDIHHLDSQEDWNAIVSKAKKSYSKPYFVHPRTFLHYAALVACIVGSVFFYRLLDRDTVIESDESKAVITLELGNGKTQILLQKGVSTIVNSNGKVLGTKNQGIVDYSQNEVGAGDNTILEYNTLHIPNGKTFEIVLSDGTHVYLNSGSTLKYPIKFVNEKNREVSLTGEAFFDVQKNEKSPFIVTSGNMNIRVLGTRFNVSSYPEDSKQTAVLVEGAVKIYEAGTTYKEDEATLLAPGYKADWDDNLKIPELKKVDTDIYTGWLSGKLIMKKNSFASIIQRLQRHYGVKIINDYSALNDRIYSATFESETIDEVLQTFNVETPFEYDINGDIIHIYEPLTLNNKEANEAEN